MSDHDRQPGEINTLILTRITEVAGKVEAVANGQNDLKLSMQLNFQAGTHRMDGLAQRIETLEKNGCPRLAQHQQAIADCLVARRSDKPQPVDQRDIPTDRITKGSSFKLDMPTLIKIGMLIGAVLAGYAAAGKVGP